MTTYGITDEGFEIKPLETIKTEIEDSLKANIDPGLNTSATSVTGQFVGVVAAAASEVWEALQATHSSFDPEQASGLFLDFLSSLTGTLREAATKSTVTATVSLTNGTTLPIGSQAYVSGDIAAIFTTIEEVSNTSGITANVSVQMEALSTGPTVANAGTLTVISTPVSGWNSITNAEAAVAGVDQEVDSALRLRREQELRATGAASVEALLADIVTVSGVEEARIFENTTLVTDGDGIPGKAFEALVLGGTDAAVASQIFLSKAAGIQAYGTTLNTVTDTQGFTHQIDFTRPTEKTILFRVELTKDTTYPSDGDSQVKTNINTQADADLGIGDSIIVSRYYDPVFSVAGVTDVTVLKAFDTATLEAQNLNETAFTTHAKWDTTGDMTDTTGAGVYTHSTGVGTLTQTSANMALAGTASRWYKFSYTVSGSTGDCAAVVTTAFAREQTALNLTAGTNTTYIFSAAAPGSFIISATSTAGGFTIDDVSLKAVTAASGNYTVTSRSIALVDANRVAVIAT